MKKSLIAALACLGALSPAAFADSFTDRARVLSATPIYERIPIAREECWNDRVSTYEERRITRSDTGAPIGPGTVLGAVVGGVIGHQFGDSSRSRDRGAAAGAVVGGLIGHQADRERYGGGSTLTEVERVPVTRDVERCRVVNEVREATVGYDVRYEYRGREFVTRMPFDPGRMLEVRVNVHPIEDAPRPAPPPRRYR